MKRVALFFLTICLSSFSYSQIIYSASAVIPFDSSLTEVFSGTTPSFSSPSSFEFIEDRNGNPNSAVKLSTILDYGNPAFSNMDTTDFTIAFWFRKDGSLWSEKSILQKRNIDVSDPNNVIYEEYSVRYNDWVGHSAQIRFKPFNDSAEVGATLGLIEDSVWRHFAVVFDRSDSLHAYLDGQLYQSKYIGNTEQYEANIENAVLEIGNGNVSLDDVYFFRYALNDSEVDELYNSEYTSIEVIVCGPWYIFSLYPNPSSTGLFNVSFGEEHKQVEIQVYDMLGRAVEISKSQNHSNIVQFQLINAAAGNYQVHIQTNQENFVESIQVE